jgi:hypothetical protein
MNSLGWLSINTDNTVNMAMSKALSTVGFILSAIEFELLVRNTTAQAIAISQSVNLLAPPRAWR